jgi:hypothetical protein
MLRARATPIQVQEEKSVNVKGTKVSVLKATIYGKSVHTAALMVVVLYVGQDLGECPKLCRVAEL